MTISWRSIATPSRFSRANEAEPSSVSSAISRKSRTKARAVHRFLTTIVDFSRQDPPVPSGERVPGAKGGMEPSRKHQSKHQTVRSLRSAGSGRTVRVPKRGKCRRNVPCPSSENAPVRFPPGSSRPRSRIFPDRTGHCREQGRIPHTRPAPSSPEASGPRSARRSACPVPSECF